MCCERLGDTSVGKQKVVPSLITHCIVKMNAEVEVYLHAFLTSALEGGESCESREFGAVICRVLRQHSQSYFRPLILYLFFPSPFVCFQVGLVFDERRGRSEQSSDFLLAHASWWASRLGQFIPEQSRYPHNRKLGAPHNRCRRCGEEKSLATAEDRIPSLTLVSLYTQVPILTELPKLTI
jgi:hypothetical protein